jgi:hypothetical protein
MPGTLVGRGPIRPAEDKEAIKSLNVKLPEEVWFLSLSVEFVKLQLSCCIEGSKFKRVRRESPVIEGAGVHEQFAERKTSVVGWDAST